MASHLQIPDRGVDEARGHPAQRTSHRGISRPHLADLPVLLALGMALSYAVFSTLAAFRFPGGYGPWNNNTLSQLGNRTLNPHGATWYLIGCAVSGCFAVAFFISLSLWHRGWSPFQNRLLLVVQALGVVGGVGLFLQAFYPETSYATHHFLAGVDFNSFAAAMVLAPIALWRRGQTNLPVTLFCVFAFIAVIAMFAFAGSHWVEWLPVMMFLIFPPFIAFIVHARGEQRQSV